MFRIIRCPTVPCFSLGAVEQLVCLQGHKSGKVSRWHSDEVYPCLPTSTPGPIAPTQLAVATWRGQASDDTRVLVPGGKPQQQTVRKGRARGYKRGCQPVATDVRTPTRVQEGRARHAALAEIQAATGRAAWRRGNLAGYALRAMGNHSQSAALLLSAWLALKASLAQQPHLWPCCNTRNYK